MAHLTVLEDELFYLKCQTKGENFSFGLHLLERASLGTGNRCCGDARKKCKFHFVHQAFFAVPFRLLYCFLFVTYSAFSGANRTGL